MTIADSTIATMERCKTKAVQEPGHSTEHPDLQKHHVSVTSDLSCASRQEPDVKVCPVLVRSRTPKCCETAPLEQARSNFSHGYMGTMQKKMETTRIIGIIQGLYRVSIGYWGYMGIMEKKMETVIEYRDYIGIMENEMETTR